MKTKPDTETAANLLALLRLVTKGGGIEGNPYSNPVVKRALRHMAKLRGIDSHLDAADLESDKHLHFSEQNEQAVFDENAKFRLK